MRRLLALLPAVALAAGCVILDDPVRLAIEGPAVRVEVLPAGRALGPTDRLGVIIVDARTDAVALTACISAGLRARLPRSGPTPQMLAEDAARAVVAALENAAPEGARLPPDLAAGWDWLVLVRDRSESVAQPPHWETLRGQTHVTAAHVEGMRHALELEGRVIASSSGRQVAEVTSRFVTHARSGFGVGIVAGTGAGAPFALPVVEVPAGADAMAICNAFGWRGAGARRAMTAV
ncbi:hypothetical protein [Falsiroseomonas oryziterrae]|uniref:hypothetical protein n=1 Tax=Falsiroseomonas oryziterrae TaxID=2911368 RepID=UPI001F3E8A98|nr:hypothetical protein [Roseomonas sp. NPKOSM-4]